MDADAPSITIRPATADDAAAVAEIWHHGWRDGHHGRVPQELADVRTEESFHARAAQRVDDTTVAVVDGVAAGFTMVVGDEVEQIYVDARHRGSGVAAALLAAAERTIRDRGHHQAWLAVVPGNARARAFYERAGWRDEGPFDYAAATDDGPVDVRCHRYVKPVR